jgi:3-oxoacyl-[acyl-carrier-protein] synthase-3
MSKSVGIRSLAVSFPNVVRTNEYWRSRYPEAVAGAQEKSLARLFSAKEAGAPTDAFDVEMGPYTSDPFRGTVERRALAPGENSLHIERRAAEGALAAANMAPGEVEAVMVASIIPNTLGTGNAAHLTRQMGMTVPAWNVESGCCGFMVAMQTATALVRAGEYENVLVAASSSYSHLVDDTDSLSWFLADGAGAALIGEVPEGEGVLGSKFIGTQETCNAFVFEPVPDGKGGARVRMRAGEESAGRMMRERSEPQLRLCVDGALRAAGVTLDDIKFFVVNTPTAWFARFCARALGVDPERTISMYPTYGNMGVALTTANLYHAAAAGKMRRGDLVLVYAVGSISTAGATVMRWGDVALGPMPSTDVVRT